LRGVPALRHHGKAVITIRRCAEDDFEPVLALLRQLWPDRELDREGAHRFYERHGFKRTCLLFSKEI
jgi:hypothetical protein